MKKFLWLSFASLAWFTTVQAADMVCAQVSQSAVDPTTESCQVFATPCAVPENWKAVPSCSLVTETSIGLTLEQKQAKRRTQIRERLKERAEARRQVQREKSGSKTRSSRRIGSGSFTRVKARSKRLSTYNNTNSTSLRTSTQADLSQIDLRKKYSPRGGYSNGKTKTKKTALERPAQISSATGVKRTGPLKDRLQWKTLTRQHTRQRSYGRNPYRLSARYSDSQKQVRDRQNQAVDVTKRKLSGYKIWRGQKDDASLDGVIED